MLKKELEQELNRTKLVLDYARNDIKEKDKEIERLTELCDKYEEEHKTTFEQWQEDIKRIDNALEYINDGSFDGSSMCANDLRLLLSGIIVRSDKE